MRPGNLPFGDNSSWSLDRVLIALIALFFFGMWGAADRGSEERRDWAREVVLLGIGVAALIAVDSILLLHAAFENWDFPEDGPVRGFYTPLLLILSEGFLAACAVMAGAILVAWATRVRPAGGPRVPFLFLAGGIALCGLLRLAPWGRTQSISHKVDKAVLERLAAVVDAWGRRLDLGGVLASPPWRWHGNFDRALVFLLPAVGVVACWAALRAHRKREACDEGERAWHQESVTALGLLVLILSAIRLTFLAEERIACVAVYRSALVTTNGELFFDWLRVGWFPILAAAAGAWLAYFGWTRFRPASAEQDSTTPAGG